ASGGVAICSSGSARFAAQATSCVGWPLFTSTAPVANVTSVDSASRLPLLHPFRSREFKGRSADAAGLPDQSPVERPRGANQHLAIGRQLASPAAAAKRLQYSLFLALVSRGIVKPGCWGRLGRILLSAVALQHGEIPLELPARQLNAVLVPLLALELDVAVEDVRAERFAREFRLGQCVDRLAEGLGQRDDAALPPLLRCQVVEVRLHRLRQLVALLDPLEPRVQECGEGEVWIARRIRAPDLGAGRLLRARLIQRDPDQRRAVPLGPGDVDRGLVAGDEPLVRVDPLREDRRDLARVVKLARDEGLAGGREVP